ncbi:MAG: type III-A CRISPR-associated protein Cas10/Csm1 [Methanobrevibacter sp.]
MDKNKENVEFAGILHDIGKFSYRANEKIESHYKNLDKDEVGETGAHAKWSADFIMKYFNNEEMADLVLHHHEFRKSKNPNLCRMVKYADQNSSYERDKLKEGETNNVKRTPLVSIFSEISINDHNSIPELYVPLDYLKLKEDNGKDCFRNVIPRENVKVNSKRYSELWRKFTEEMDSLNKKDDFTTILYLLKKYTSNIPSAAYLNKPDISLYDHLKSTAALANCRYLFNKYFGKLFNESTKQKLYLTINGDISGIQKFIYKISSPQEAQSGMSKRLRGRSLYLTLLCDAIASHIVEELELTKANIVFCGGGRFTIIAPNTKIVKDRLLKIKDNVNKFFIKEFNSELYLAIVYKECLANDLKNFGDILYLLSNELEEDKKHKFINNLEDVFNISEVNEKQELCSVCGQTYNKKDDTTICNKCHEHEELGKKSSHANYIIKIYSKDHKNLSRLYKRDYAVFENLNLMYIFVESDNINELIEKLIEFVDKIEIIKLNSTDFIDLENDNIILKYRNKISFSFQFIGNNIPNLGEYSQKKYENMPLYFEHLAQISEGSNKLGILKMDVDNLGTIFREGFEKEHEDSTDDEENKRKTSTISRVSTLSSQLDMFFSGFINNIASEFKVYSNSYNKQIRSKLREITLQVQDDSKNDDNESIVVFREKSNCKLTEKDKEKLSKYEIPTIYINYSGGDDLLVIGPYDHIICFAKELREKFKEWTCNNPSINISGGISIVSAKFPIGKSAIIADKYLESAKSCGRDKITLFEEVVNWDTKNQIKGFNDLLDYGAKLEKFYNDKYISKNFIYFLLKLWYNSYENESYANDPDKWNENMENRLKITDFKPLYKYKLRLIDNYKTFTYLTDNMDFMPWIKIPVSWASLRMR